ncbi:MAG: 2'-5' RNA ligase family protein, partial [Candidatus Norongarragalinales archaeon]
MNETKLKKLVIGLRCFVSLEIPAEAKQKIGELSAKAKALGLHATFTSPEEWHVTLAFLGEITESKAAETAAKLKGALQGMK